MPRARGRGRTPPRSFFSCFSKTRDGGPGSPISQLYRSRYEQRDLRPVLFAGVLCVTLSRSLSPQELTRWGLLPLSHSLRSVRLQFHFLPTNRGKFVTRNEQASGR